MYTKNVVSIISFNFQEIGLSEIIFKMCLSQIRHDIKYTLSQTQNRGGRGGLIGFFLNSSDYNSAYFSSTLLKLSSCIWYSLGSTFIGTKCLNEHNYLFYIQLKMHSFTKPAKPPHGAGSLAALESGLTAYLCSLAEQQTRPKVEGYCKIF